MDQRLFFLSFRRVRLSFFVHFTALSGTQEKHTLKDRLKSSMFQDLKERLAGILGSIGQKGVLKEADIDKTLREIRVALLEADVALTVITPLLARIKDKALGADVAKSLTPGQVVIKIVHDELVLMLSHEGGHSLDLAARPPVVILMVGLQGSGKTTTSAKLAAWLNAKHNKKVLLTSTDVYRPAARTQLQQLSNQNNLNVALFLEDDAPLSIAQKALSMAKSEGYDVLIVDTAGRLQIDAPLMDELEALGKVLTPKEVLFVADAMMGQEAAQIAQTFHARLPITGSILTRTEGDARGGAALSIGAITGRPLKFVGLGERVADLEIFDPARQAGRILGQGDIVSFVEEVQSQVDQKDAEDMAKKMQSGTFTLNDLAKQLGQMQRMGSFEKLLGLIPGMDGLKKHLLAATDETTKRDLSHQLAIIRSMTPRERRYPKLLDASRKRRIAKGAGRDVSDINRLLKQFDQMEKMMKRFKKMGKRGMMPHNMTGLMPPKGFPGKRF